ncbi:MAG: excinuclease ABC subunit UvrA [bacterium]
MADWIEIKGARQNNLKNIDVSIPKNKLVVITGPSGAGKSSLAFDTLYAEGHRRYVESLAPSARQFLGQLEKPDLDALLGLSPAIAVAQPTGTPNPRSTVGTASDIHDFLRLLFARVGVPHCHRCGEPIVSHTVQQVVDRALERTGAPRLLVCAPIAYDPAHDFRALLEDFRREGLVRVRVDGAMVLLEEAETPPTRADGLEVVVDRLTLRDVDTQRLTEAVELAFRFGKGLARLVFMGEGKEMGEDTEMGKDTEAQETYSATPRCNACGITYPAPHPNQFSFNSPHGACGSCHGLGNQHLVSPERVVPDPSRSLAEGAIAPWEKKTASAFQRLIEQVAGHYGFSILVPFSQLEEAHRQVLLQGSGGQEIEFAYEGDEDDHRYRKSFEGVIPNLERRFRETDSPAVREGIRRYMDQRVCPECHGERLRIESRHYQVGGLSIAAVTALPLPQAKDWADGLDRGDLGQEVSEPLLGEISSRLGFLCEVGLEYLELDREMGTLSNGESQRIRLATQIGAALSGVIYILDEPTIGLHQRDTERLLRTLAELRDAGNTVVVVEHDRETMLAADWLLEIGPRAGEEGGRLVAEGSPAAMREHPDSVTGHYLSGRRTVPVPGKRRPVTGKRLVMAGASDHNLNNLTVEIPLGVFLCVTGASGSGKSSLILDTLYPAVMAKLRGESLEGLALEDLQGAHQLERVIHIDQSPIGKSPRSNPATYLGVFELVREQFAALPEARTRGYQPRRFSFNVPGGRCEACQGDGVKRIEMHFLPDVFVRCEVCSGRRYNRETQEIRYRGRNISDILAMTMEAAEAFFRALPAIRSKLAPLLEVGLGYLPMGQPANTLSGGEAQRLKIARELARRETGRTLYLLDEPTTGLHFEDVERLLAVLNRLVEGGNSVVVIEHNMEMIKCADYLIDMGPDGGSKGGNIVARGTPEELIELREVSHTATYLSPYLTY